MTLFLVALIGVGLAATGTAWSEKSRRDKEVELIRVGSVYAKAIASYYAKAPGSVKRYPTSLSDLIEDRRFVGTHRHLRQLYVDPMTNNANWGLVRADDGGIRGVYSLSSNTPLLQTAKEIKGIRISAANSYREWRFNAPDPVVKVKR